MTRRLLDLHYATIVRDLDADDIIDDLVGVLGKGTIAQIRNHKDSKEKTRELISAIQCNGKSFTPFLASLAEHGYSELVRLLISSEN